MSETAHNNRANAQLNPSKPYVLAAVPVDGTVGDIQINPVTNRIYFIRGEAGYGVLDGQTNQIVASASAGEAPTYLAINQRTNRIYITNFRDGTVSVINGRTNRVIAAVKVGVQPFGLAVNTRTNLIYVANRGGSISVIDGRNNRVYKTFKVGGFPSLVTVNERTNRIYVTNTRSNSVIVINGTTQTVIARVKVGKNPILSPGINSKTNRIYIPNNLSRYVSVINGMTNKPLPSIRLGRLQSELAVNEATNCIYVTSAQQEGPGKLFAINGLTNKVMRTLQIPTFSSLSVNPNTNHVFVGDTEGNRLTVYNGRTLQRVARLTTQTYAGAMACNPRTNRLYVGNDGYVTVIQDINKTVNILR